MDTQVISATEYVLHLPRRSKTLSEVLQAAEVVGGEILASCTHRRDEADVHHIAVGADPMFEPHFRSTYNKAVERREIIVLRGPAAEERPFGALLAALDDQGVEIDYCYGQIDEAEKRLALSASDVSRGLAVLREAAARLASTPRDDGDEA